MDNLRTDNREQKVDNEELKKKISSCGFFVVLSTKNYLELLRRSDENITNQINIARELKKPFLIIEDTRMLPPDIEEARRYFSKDNVVDKISINLGNDNSAGLVAKKIRDVSRMFCPEERSINIVTCYPEDDNV